jgi:hypothetical protein
VQAARCCTLTGGRRLLRTIGSWLARRLNTHLTMMKCNSLVLISITACRSSHPPAVAPDASALCPIGGCALLAIEPSIATAGDTITLEGTFASDAVVNFPGGSVTANVLGLHRATAVVPAAATAGDLTVTAGGTTVGPVSFRRASFQFGLQPFQTYSTLPVARHALSAIAVGGSAYVIGGSDSSIAYANIDRAAINPDGSLGAFTSAATLTTQRTFILNATVIAGRFVYVVGGSPDGATALATVERAPILADGSLGAFAIVPNVQLVRARWDHAVAVIGDRLYVIGGATNAGASFVFLDSVESAQINTDGSLGTFVEVGHIDTPREAHGVIVTSSSLYVIGGDRTAGGFPAIATIERAPIFGDGTLGSFVSTGSLSAARQSFLKIAMGSGIVVAGGGGLAGDETSVEAATIGTDGMLGTFATIPNTTIAVNSGAGLVAGDFVYAISGVRGGVFSNAITRASIDVSGGFP